MVCVSAACPPSSIPVRTTGSSSARAAYGAAESPAGPEPSTSTLTCLGVPLLEESLFKDIVNLVSSIAPFYQMPGKGKSCKGEEKSKEGRRNKWLYDPTTAHPMPIGFVNVLVELLSAR